MRPSAVDFWCDLHLSSNPNALYKLPQFLVDSCLFAT